MTLHAPNGGESWVVVSPAPSGCGSEIGSITTKPIKRTVAVRDLDALFVGYEGDFTPVEGAFSNPAGGEKL